MDLVGITSKDLIDLFEKSSQEKIRQVYEIIPGTFVTFLEKRNCLERIHFRNDLASYKLQMGTKDDVNFANFELAVRRMLKESFDVNHVTSVSPEDLSRDISNRYQQAFKNRPGQGERATHTLSYDKVYQKRDGGYRASVNAHVQLHVVEECENNWLVNDNRSFSYKLNIELKGISMVTTKVLQISALIDGCSVSDAVEAIRSRCPYS